MQVLLDDKNVIKGQQKGKEDTGNCTASQDVETDLDETDLRPFERLRLTK